jgi:RNase P/RNase MRP subunit p29
VHNFFWLENLNGEGHAEDIGIKGRIILEAVNRINLAQDKDRWQALVNTVMNLLVL